MRCKAIIPLFLAITLLLCTACSSDNAAKSVLYYDYDITSYISVGAFKNEVQRNSDDYEKYLNSFYNETFGDDFKTVAYSGVVEKWDTVNISYTAYYDGEIIEGEHTSDYEFIVGLHNISVDGFEDEIIGRKIGNKFEVQLQLPDDHISGLGGKTADFSVCVNYAVKKSLPSDSAIKEYGFETLRDYEMAADEYAVKLCLFYNVYENTDFKSYPEKETQIMLDEIVAKYSAKCEAQGYTFSDLATSYGKSEEEYKETLKETIQKDSQSMPCDLVSHYILQLYDSKLTYEDVEKTRDTLKQKHGDDLDAVGYTEIEIQRLSAYEKALDVLYERATVK